MTMLFTTITEDLQKELKKNFAQIRFLIKKNPGIAYKEILEIGKKVGKKYNIELLVNFPHEGKIDNNANSYPATPSPVMRPLLISDRYDFLRNSSRL